MRRGGGAVRSAPPFEKRNANVDRQPYMRTACTFVLKASVRRYLAIRLSEMFPDDSLSLLFPDDSLSLRLANATIPVAPPWDAAQEGQPNGVRFVPERR